MAQTTHELIDELKHQKPERRPLNLPPSWDSMGPKQAGQFSGVMFTNGKLFVLLCTHPTKDRDVLLLHTQIARVDGSRANAFEVNLIKRLFFHPDLGAVHENNQNVKSAGRVTRNLWQAVQRDEL